MWNVYCPYGNSMPNNQLNIVMVFLVSFGLFAFTWILYRIIIDGTNKKRVLIGVILGVFTLITFLLNLAMSNQWIIIGD